MRSFALSLLLLAALPAAAQEAPQHVLPPHVAAQGTAEIRVAPDLAVIRLGVQHQATEPGKAIDAVNTGMQKVIAAVRKQGVPEKRIATERLELQPVYDHQHMERDGTPRLVGYRAANVVRIEVPITGGEGKKMGGVIDAALKAGANNVEGIQFQLENEAPHRTKALRAAAEDGKAKAAAIAESLGVRTGPLLQAAEAGVDSIGPPPMPYMERGMAMMKADTSVQPGEMTIRASVVVRYRLQQ